MSSPASRHTVVVAGGGAAGLTVAALLKAARGDLDVAVIERSAHRYYQPAWTLAGTGAFELAKTRCETARGMPAGVTWSRERAAGFDPSGNRVPRAPGAQVECDPLVVAAGLQLDRHRIEELGATPGSRAVTGDHRFDLISRPAPGNACAAERRFSRNLPCPSCARAHAKDSLPGSRPLAAAASRRRWHFFTPAPAMFGVLF